MTPSLRIAGFCALIAVSLQGCARGTDIAPSYLGFPAIAGLGDDDTGPAPLPPGEQRPELRHVASNKVLGAMAFQKTTGRAVDPTRLQGHR